MADKPTFPPIDFRSELNEDQFGAVTSQSRNALVLAGAGSGKTRTLTYRVAWLLEQGVPPWRILLLTFTNKAAGEMLERIEDLTGIPRSQFWGGTFHSIGQRILRANAYAVGLNPDFTILDADDADALFSNVCKQVAPDFIKGKNSPTPRVIFDVVSYARNTRSPIEKIAKERLEWAPQAEEIVPALWKEYTAAKRLQNSCDYDDLLELLCELLRNDPPARERYGNRFRHILVDEFQDTNSLQSEIVRLISGPETHVMAVGDDAQCIYTWRGANYKNIVDFPINFPDTQLHKIEINYRSTPEILDFSNSILSARTEESGFSKQLRATREHGAPPYVIPQINADDEANAVISKICSLVEDEGYSLSDIIILYRSHFHARIIEKALSFRFIPFVMTSGLRFHQKAHIRDFIAQLRFVQNHNDRVAFTRILNLIDKIGPRTAERILEAGNNVASNKNIKLLTALLDKLVLKKVPEVARDDYQDLILTLQDMSEALHGKEIQTGATAAELSQKIAKTPDEENSLGELFDFFADGNEYANSVLTENDIAKTENTVLATPAEVVRIGIDGWYGDFLKKIYSDWQERYTDLTSLIDDVEKFPTLSEFLSSVALLDEETTVRDDGGNDSLRLSTIHQAKGLEFPVVFIIGCADGLFPLRRAIEEGDLDEERRLFYVACTRAKEKLFMLYPKISSGRDSSLLDVSQFIREAEPSSYRMFYGSPRSF